MIGFSEVLLVGQVVSPPRPLNGVRSRANLEVEQLTCPTAGCSRYLTKRDTVVVHIEDEDIAAKAFEGPTVGSSVSIRGTLGSRRVYSERGWARALVVVVARDHGALEIVEHQS